MKGKGKGDRKAEPKEEAKDCPLHFPQLKSVEHLKNCIRYSSILNREQCDTVGVEELDILQTELEMLLASVAKRMRQLEGEINILNNWQEKNPKDKKIGGAGVGKVQPETPTVSASPSGKRSGKGTDDKSAKRFKDSSGKATSTPSKGTSTPSKATSTPSKATTAPSKATSTPTSNKPQKGKGQAKIQEPETPESSPTKPCGTGTPFPAVVTGSQPLPTENPSIRVIKNDAPKRFWSMVEPYCREIGSDDMKVLEDIMHTHEDEAEYYKIPSLGKHYSQKWAHEDLLEEQRESSKINKKGSVNNNNSKSNAGDASSVLKRLEERGEEQSPFGPLTQRLVQALIEENIMAPLDDTPISEAEAVEAATISPRSLAKQLNLGNAAALERRIKRELEEQGIFEVEDRPEDNPDDEILIELRKKQQELRALSQHNLLITKRLYKFAKEELNRQELRKKMAVADAEVMEVFRKIQATKQKKKAPTKKEKEAAWKVLKERESIVKQLENSSSQQN